MHCLRACVCFISACFSRAVNLAFGPGGHRYDAFFTLIHTQAASRVVETACAPPMGVRAGRFGAAAGAKCCPGAICRAWLTTSYWQATHHTVLAAIVFRRRMGGGRRGAAARANRRSQLHLSSAFCSFAVCHRARGSSLRPWRALTASAPMQATVPALKRLSSAVAHQASHPEEFVDCLSMVAPQCSRSPPSPLCPHDSAGRLHSVVKTAAQRATST